MSIFTPLLPFNRKENTSPCSCWCCKHQKMLLFHLSCSRIVSPYHCLRARVTKLFVWPAPTRKRILRIFITELSRDKKCTSCYDNFDTNLSWDQWPNQTVSDREVELSFHFLVSNYDHCLSCSYIWLNTVCVRYRKFNSFLAQVLDIWKYIQITWCHFDLSWSSSLIGYV